MEYKKYEYDNYKIHYIKTDRFKTNLVSLAFVKDYEKKDDAYSRLLFDILTLTTKKYNTRKKFVERIEELYMASLSCDTAKMGALKIIELYVEYINPKYTEESMDKESIDLLFEVLTNPNIENKKFDESLFEEFKKTALEMIKAMKDYPEYYANSRFTEIFNEGNILSFSEEERIKTYEEITMSKLYQYYLKIFKMDLNVILIGNFKDDEEIVKYVKNKLDKFSNKTIKCNSVYLENKPRKKVKIVKEQKEVNQSQLYLGYKFEDLTDFEKKYVLKLFTIILGGDINSLLFKKVREENQLCYTINSKGYLYLNSLIIYSGINKSNYDEAVKLIKECVKCMEDVSVIEQTLSRAKSNYHTSLNTFYDNVSNIHTHYLLSEFDKVDSIEVQKEMVSKVTEKDIVTLAKKMKLDTIYLLEGTKENERN